MEKNNGRLIEVEIAYAAEQQVLRRLSVIDGATIADVIAASAIQEEFPEIDLTKQKVGIFSHACELERKVKQGDRIEIYRPLLIDPKEARRLRASRKK